LRNAVVFACENTCDLAGGSASISGGGNAASSADRNAWNFELLIFLIAVFSLMAKVLVFLLVFLLAENAGVSAYRNVGVFYWR